MPAFLRSRISRREFLRISLALGGGAALSACGSSLPEAEQPTIPAPAASSTPVLSPTPTPTSTPQVEGQVRLLGRQGEAWTWTKEISGSLVEIPDCQDVFFEVNGLAHPANWQGEEFSADLPLVEGENRIIAICRRANGEEEKSAMLHYYERLRSAPTARIHISLDGSTVVLDGRQSSPAEPGGAEITDHVWSQRHGNPPPLILKGSGGMPDRDFSAEVSGQVIRVEAPALDGEYYIRLRVTDKDGLHDTSTIYFVVENGTARIPDYDKENTAWVESAVVYGVIPRNFGAPAFRAVAEKLDELAELGINALWLAPVNVSPPGDYGYAIVDYFELNPKYGTKEDFHRLVQEAHARGIRVLMDFVPNHSSDQHPYFLDAQKYGKESNYWDFYDRDEEGKTTYYFSWTHLPNLNYDNPEVQRWMLEAFSYWVREFDVDGFRVDVAWGIRQRRPDFWPLWRRELKRIKPDLMLLAEASARDQYYFDNGYDVGYDWTDQLGKWAWELVWDSYQHRLLAYNLEAALTNRPDGYHPDALVFRFLNNNDTGERFITRHGEGMARVATALLLTLPGVPCVYTGDEVGAEFKPYENPEPIQWAERFPGLRDYHKKLISLRKAVPALHSRSWRRLETDPIPQVVFAYLRYLEPAEQPVIVVLNFSAEPADVTLHLPEAFHAPAHARLFDLLAEEDAGGVEGGIVRVQAGPHTARILTSQPS